MWGKIVMLDWWSANFPQGKQTVTITDANGQAVELAWGERGTGPILLLLHGWGSWSVSWQALIVPLSQYFRVICFDAKGYGYSQRTAATEQIGHQIIETARFIEKIGENTPIFILSESLGAWLALTLAAEYPQLINKIVVISPPVYPRIMPNWAMRLFVKIPRSVVRLADYLRIIRVFAPLLVYLTHQQQKEVYYRSDKVSTTAVRTLLSPYFTQKNSLLPLIEDTRLAALELNKLQQKQPNLISQLQENLSLIQCSVLILWGEQDRWFPVDDAYRLQRDLLHAELHILPECGHHAAGDCPNQVMQHVLTFLNRDA
jgi:pimeloyl-ACP methyl ester carboxylesterase